MCSTHKTTLGVAMVALAALVLAGCQRANVAQVQPPSPAIPTDDAMLIRTWDTSVSWYPNGAVAAWPTGFWFEPSDQLPWWGVPLVEPGLFVAQTLLLPVAYVVEPPWKEKIYAGVVIPPTYTGSPQLPPAPPVGESADMQQGR